MTKDIREDLIWETTDIQILTVNRKVDMENLEEIGEKEKGMLRMIGSTHKNQERHIREVQQIMIIPEGLQDQIKNRLIRILTRVRRLSLLSLLLNQNLVDLITKREGKKGDKKNFRKGKKVMRRVRKAMKRCLYRLRIK